MFYTHVLLDKHGILAKIWIAAHWHKKLTKSNIFECNLETAIKNILSAKMVMSLRISGHLLLGVVRVYNRKTKYLLADCNESLLKMKLAFRPEMLDLSDANQEARYNAITLQEQFHDFDNQLPDLNNIDVVDHFTLNQSRAEDITMKEDYAKQLILYESFDPLRQDFDTKENSFEVSSNSVLQENSFVGDMNDGAENFLNQDNFGDEGTAANFFANSDLFAEYNDLSFDGSKEVTLPVSPHDQEKQFESELSAAADLGSTDTEMPMENSAAGNNSSLQSEISFVLEPLDIAEMEKRKRTRKKRKLMVDELKQISSSLFRQQLEDTSDTLTTLEIGPPTHCMLEWKKTGGVQWLLSQPAQPIINAELQSLFTQSRRTDTAKRQQSDTAQKAQEKPAEPEPETPQREQEDQVPLDLPQLESDAVTDVSSIYTEEPPGMQELAGFDQAVTNESSLAQEESSKSIQDSEEHQWTKKTQKMLHYLNKMNQSGITTFSFNKICVNNKKKRASANFYSLLVLKNRNAIRMAQNSPYSDIIITAGAQFHSS